MGRIKTRRRVASVRLSRRITSTCQSLLLPRAAVADCAQWVEPHGCLRRRSRPLTQLHHDRRDCSAAAVGVSRFGAERERDMIAVTHRLGHSPNRALAADQSRRVQKRARRANGELLVDKSERPGSQSNNKIASSIETVANDADTANAGDGSVPARPCRDGNCRRLRPRSHRGTGAADTAMTPSRPGMGACARSWPH